MPKVKKKDIQLALDLLIQALQGWGAVGKDDKKYYNRTRAALRRLSIKWIHKNKYLESISVPYKGADKRIKKLYPCTICKVKIVRGKGEVDHKIGCGSLLCEEDVVPFIIRLFAGIDGYRFLCKECHVNNTNEQRKRGWK